MSELTAEQIGTWLANIKHHFFFHNDWDQKDEQAYEEIRTRLPKEVSREWVEKWVAVFVPLDIPAECMHSTIEQNRLRVEKLLKELGHEVGE